MFLKLGLHITSLDIKKRQYKGRLGADKSAEVIQKVFSMTPKPSKTSECYGYKIEVFALDETYHNL